MRTCNWDPHALLVSLNRRKMYLRCFSGTGQHASTTCLVAKCHIVTFRVEYYTCKSSRFRDALAKIIGQHAFMSMPACISLLNVVPTHDGPCRALSNAPVLVSCEVVQGQPDDRGFPGGGCPCTDAMMAYSSDCPYMLLHNHGHCTNLIGWHTAPQDLNSVHTSHKLSKPAALDTQGLLLSVAHEYQSAT